MIEFQDSKHLDVLKRLTAHLEGINPANDYPLDLTGKVYRGRLVFTQEEPYALSLLESPKPDFPLEVGSGVQRKDVWNLLLQGFVPDDANNPSDQAYGLKAVTEHRLSRLIARNDQGNPLYPQEYLLGKTVIEMNIGQGIVRPPGKEVSNSAVFYLPLTIQLDHRLDQPFVQP